MNISRIPDLEREIATGAPVEAELRLAMEQTKDPVTQEVLRTELDRFSQRLDWVQDTLKNLYRLQRFQNERLTRTRSAVRFLTIQEVAA